MAHEVFAIEKLVGENTNQPARAHGAPAELVARFKRVGGYTPHARRSVTPHYGKYGILSRLGADWLGFSAWRDNITGRIDIAYSQTGMYASNAATEINNAKFAFVVPGGGVYGLDGTQGNLFTSGNEYLRDPVLTASFFIDGDGNNGVYRTPKTAPYAPVITQVAGGGFSAGSTIFVLFVYFERTVHGLMPTDIKYATHTLTADNSGWQVGKNGITFVPGYYIYAYAWIYDASSGDTTEWTTLYRGADGQDWVDQVGSGIMVMHPADWPQNALPALYGSFATQNDTHEYTLAVGRAFFVSKYATAWTFHVYQSSGAYHLFLVNQRTTPEPFTQQGVFYTDIIGNMTHVAFSDNPDGPNYLRFDDIIRAIVPSNRGIYAMSQMSTWEAFGDFVTANNTRVSLVPVLGGVDSGHDTVAFSGDTAYFIKNGIVHSIGPGGVKQIGRSELLNEDTFATSAIGNVKHIAYDRTRRRLFAARDVGSNEVRIVVYDPSFDGWYTYIQSAPTTIYSTGTITVLSGNKYRIGSNDYAETDLGDVVPMRIVWAKLDFGLPLHKKRIHRIVIPYIGSYDNFDWFRIYDSNDFTRLKECTVLDKGEYFEIRCPSMVARAFDIDLKITSDDKEFALNPPIIIEYQYREASYGNK